MSQAILFPPMFLSFRLELLLKHLTHGSKTCKACYSGQRKAKTPIPKPWDAGLCLTRCITTSTDLLRHEAHGLWNKLSRQWDLMHFSCISIDLVHLFGKLLRLLQLLQPIKEVEDFFEAKGHWQSSKQDHGLFETLCLSFPLVLRSSTPHNGMACLAHAHWASNSLSTNRSWDSSNFGVLIFFPSRASC